MKRSTFHDDPLYKSGLTTMNSVQSVLHLFSKSGIPNADETLIAACLTMMARIATAVSSLDHSSGQPTSLTHRQNREAYEACVALESHFRVHTLLIGRLKPPAAINDIVKLKDELQERARPM